MDISVTGWIFTVLIVFVASFGFYGCVKIFIIISAFLLGIVSVIHLLRDHSKPFITKSCLLSNPLESQKKFQKSRLSKKEDTNDDFFQITGHKDVDCFIHDLVDILVNDYICTWYNSLSSNQEFIKVIKHFCFTFILEISNRVKSVDWLLYITSQTIEDIALHLCLFRKAGGGVDLSSFRQSRHGSPVHSTARTTHHHRRNKSDTDVASFYGTQTSALNNILSDENLEQKFFEAELNFEKTKYCRERICKNNRTKLMMLREMSQMLLLMTIESEELKCSVTHCILRSILSHSLYLIIGHITNSDNLNALLLRSIHHESLSTECFLNVLRTTNNIEEIKSTLLAVQNEIHNLVSRDSGGECDIAVKQQLSSLQYLTRLLSNRSSMLTPTATPSVVSSGITKLPLGFLLDNHLPLCHFLDFAHSLSSHAYIFCHLSIEAWNALVFKYLAERKSNVMNKSSIEAIRSSAITIYDQYFSENSKSPIIVPETILERFLNKVKNSMNENSLAWFDEIDKYIYSKLEALDTAFRNSNQYIRLLAELDLEDNVVCDNTRCGDHRRSGSMESNVIVTKPISDSATLNQLTDPVELSNSNEKGDMLLFCPKIIIKNTQTPTCDVETKLTQSNKDEKCMLTDEDIHSSTSCRLEVVIVETGLMQERSKTFGVYALEVRKWDASGKQYCWHVYRRYSDFHELNNTLKEIYPELSKLDFPSKQTFHNTSRNVLERRMEMLSSWIHNLALLGSPGGPTRYEQLHSYLLPFLNPQGYQDKSQTINAVFVQPIRQRIRTLKNVSGQFVNTVDDFVGGIYKFINTNKTNLANNPYREENEMSNSKPPTMDKADDSEDLPLRVVLLLLDEVFELRSHNRWLRRQIVTVLRQILTTMFSDVLNRKIVDVISSLTSPTSVAYFLHTVKNSYSTVNNKMSDKNETRDTNTKARARVAAKTMLLSYRYEELKRLLGSQTTQRGLLTVFELFQNSTLNTRLIFVLLEGLYAIIYKDRNLALFFDKILEESQK